MASSLKCFCKKKTDPVKRYGKTNITVLYLVYGKIQVGLNFFWPVHNKNVQVQGQKCKPNPLTVETLT